MRFGDVLNIIEARARVLRLDIDSAILELGMYYQLQKLCDAYDLDAFTEDNPIMAVTTEGIETYALPDNYGRMLHPFSANSRSVVSGFRLYVSASNIQDLTYERPQDFMRLDRVTESTPNTITIIGRQLYLNPVPNSNSSSNYQVQGTYIKRFDQPDLDDDVTIEEPSFLVSATLLQMAQDNPDLRIANIETLMKEHRDSLSVIVNGQARRRQALYRSTERPGRGYR